MNQLQEHLNDNPDEYLEAVPEKYRGDWCAVFRNDAGRVTARFPYDSEEDAGYEIDAALR